MMNHISLLLLLLTAYCNSKFSIFILQRSENSSLTARQKRKLTELYPYLNVGEELGLVSDYPDNKQSGIIQDASGNILVVYLGYDEYYFEVFCQVLDINKNVVVEEFKISDSFNGADYPSVALLADNKIVVTWDEYDSGEKFIMATILNPDYSEFKSPFQINEASSIGEDKQAKVVSLTSERFVVAWLKKESSTSGYLVYFRIFNNLGEAINSPTRVDSDTVDDFTTHDLASMPEGQFVSIWYVQSLNIIRGMVLNSEGDNMIPVFEISRGYNFNDTPIVSSLNEGYFIVLWSLYRTSNTENYIHGQVYNLEGITVGSDILISDYSSENTAIIAAVTLNDGGFVTVFTRDAQIDGFRIGNLYARRFGKDWAALEEEKLLNHAITNANQDVPRVCKLSNGGYAISWQVNNEEIFMRLVEPCVAENCLSCEYSINICDSCIDGYFEPFCEACSFLCDTCSNETECEVCLSPLIKDSNSCVCPDLRTPSPTGQCYCPESSFDTQENPVSCQGCPLGCAICSSLTFCHQCFTGFYLSKFECHECQNICVDCVSFDECTECAVSYELNNGRCDCPEYYVEENSVCVYKILTFTFNETYFIEFSESLSKPLSSENILFSVFKPGNQSFDFEIEFISLSSYRLQIEGNVPNETENIHFKLQNVVSQSGSILREENSVITENIYIETSQSFDEKIEEDLIPMNIPAGTVSAVTASLGATSVAGVSFLSMNPRAIWSFMNIASMIYYMPLQNIPIPSVLRNFTADFNSNLFNIIPNVAKLARMKEEESESAPEDWISYGIDQTNLIINIGSGLFVISSGLIALPLLIIGYFTSVSAACKEFLRKRISEYKWCFFLRAWIQIYTDLMFYSQFTIFYGKNLNFYSFLSSIFLILGVLSPLVTIIYILRAEFIENETKFATLFEDFKYEKGWVFMMYYPLFFIRRLIYCAVFFFLYSFPLAQVIINSGCSIVLTIYLILYRPHRYFYVWILELFSETVLAAIFILSGFYLLDLSYEAILIVSQSITMLLMSIPIFALSIFAMTVFNKVRGFYTSRKIITRVIPIQSEQNVLEIETNSVDNADFLTRIQFDAANSSIVYERPKTVH